MDLGRELVACALREGTMRPFIEAGLSPEYLTDPNDKSRPFIFPDSTESLGAWRLLQEHWDKHGKVMSPTLFHRSYPPEALELPDSGMTSGELMEIFNTERRKALATVTASDLSDLLADGRAEDVLAYLEYQVRVLRNTHASRSTVVSWDSADYDFEARIAREIEIGVLTGIKGFDEQEKFFGFQNGHLVCYLGRAKAGKTSFALLSALAAWVTGKRVLFLSFEIAAGRLPSEPGIVDRLDAFAAKIDMLDYMQGKISRDDERELRILRGDMKANNSDSFKVVQPNGRYTIADLEADIARFEPDYVVIDGFYFMTDAATGKTGSNWEGHDAIAADIKSIAMERAIPILITHQVREKQLTGKKGAGIDDGAMMGGTGIIMFADLVIGIDADEDGNRTLTCTRSRLQYLDPVHGTWNWANCTFNEADAPFNKELFTGYQEGDDE